MWGSAYNSLSLLNNHCMSCSLCPASSCTYILPNFSSQKPYVQVRVSERKCKRTCWLLFMSCEAERTGSAQLRWISEKEPSSLVTCRIFPAYLNSGESLLRIRGTTDLFWFIFNGLALHNFSWAGLSSLTKLPLLHHWPGWNTNYKERLCPELVPCDSKLTVSPSSMEAGNKEKGMCHPTSRPVADMARRICCLCVWSWSHTVL